MVQITAIKKKICLLGSFAVGKTSLIERFVYDRFEEKYLTTIGVKISQKLMPPAQDTGSGQMRQHSFLIWDIASLDKFDKVAMNYFRGAAGALAVADLTRPETIGDLKRICKKFLSASPRATLVVLGNKKDIFHQDQPTLAELEKLAGGYCTEVLLTSAKTGEQVENAFEILSGRIGSGS
jgi:small GTP-binding protein